MTSRSSRWMCSVKIGVLGNFAKFTGKHLCQSLFFNKVAGLSLFSSTFFPEHLRPTASGLELMIQYIRDVNIQTLYKGMFQDFFM